MTAEKQAVAPEILFAQHLAANEKVYRDRALRKLQKYLFNHSSLPNGGFNESELLKIWKGLHYCMWMQDKPLIQEELCDSISNLVHSFNNQHAALLFITTFYKTECREWTSIDKWRMDKFLMLLRKMLRQSFEFLKKKNWSEKLVRQFLGFISKYILHDHSHATSPDGVRFHLADVYLTELEKVSTGQLGPKQTVTFLEPWIGMLVGIKSKTLRAFVIKNVFGELIQQSPVMLGRPRKKGSLKLRVNYQLLADKLLEAGGSEDCSSVNRPAIYNLVQNFRDVASGKLPFADEEQPEDVGELDDDDIENAVQRLAQFTDEIKTENQAEKAKLKKRKRKVIEADEAYCSDTAGDGQEEPQPQVAKPTEVTSQRKKGKRSEQRTGLLSKRLKRSLQAEEQYTAEDSDSTEGGDVEYAEEDGAEFAEEDDWECGEEDEAEEGDGDTVEKMDEELTEEEEKRQAKSVNKRSKSKVTRKNQKVGELVKNLSTNRSETTKSRKSSDKSILKTGDSMQVTADQHASLPMETPASPAKSPAKRKKQKAKTTPGFREFDVEDFPEPSKDANFSGSDELLSEHPSLSESANNKNNSSSGPVDIHMPQVGKASKDTPNENCKDFGKFVSKPEAKGKYLRKAMSKSPVTTPKAMSKTPPVTPIAMSKTPSTTPKAASKTPSTTPKAALKTPSTTPKAASKTPNTSPRSAKLSAKKSITRSQAKRLSFGKNSSVKKSAVKLRGSVSYDPSKTPEQGILKVNPIEPGTVIQVGKQATIKNTLRNSKFPQRMVAMDFF